VVRARAKLKELGYDVAVKRVPDDARPGTVIAQDPSVGSSVWRGDTVTLKVSTGPGPPTPFKAEIESHSAASEVSSELLHPVTNGCRIYNDRTTMLVYAGIYARGASNSSTGMFLIGWTGEERPPNRPPEQVKIPKAGALRITGVRLDQDGGHVRPRGELQFSSSRGVTGFLNLEDGSVTITS
jgi:hypothetical protein